MIKKRQKKNTCAAVLGEMPCAYSGAAFSDACAKPLCSRPTKMSDRYLFLLIDPNLGVFRVGETLTMPVHLGTSAFFSGANRTTFPIIGFIMSLGYQRS